MGAEAGLLKFTVEHGPVGLVQPKAGGKAEDDDVVDVEAEEEEVLFELNTRTEVTIMRLGSHPHQITADPSLLSPNVSLSSINCL